MNLKEFLREVRQTHDENIANTYVAKTDVDFDATDLADVFANAGASSPTQPQTGSNKLTPTLTLSKPGTGIDDCHRELPYTYNGDGMLFAQCDSAYAHVDTEENKVKLFFEESPYYSRQTVGVTLHATEGENYAANTITFEYEENG